MQPHERRATATTRARTNSRSHSRGSYSTMYGGSGGGATALASTIATSGDALAGTLSIKDVQRCFEKERHAFLRDLESLRQQLMKKEQVATKAATIASQHAVQLKKEIASLQAALSASEKEASTNAQQFRHTSALLETAMDQHQADQAKLAELSVTIRTTQRKHDDALTVVRKESSANVNSSHEERKALRARVDQLRAKLETERKEFLALKTPLQDDLAKASVRLTVLEKELGESRYRETASVQLKEKIQSEVLQYKRKVSDLSTALHEALASKSEQKATHQLLVGKMKDKWRDLLVINAQAKEQLVMLQEDYNGLFRSRALGLQQHDRMLQSLQVLKQRHEQQLKEKDTEYYDLEKRSKRTSVTCTTCLKTPEQRQEVLEAQMEAARVATRREVVQEMELERWDRFQDVNAKYMDVTSQLQAALRDRDQWQRESMTLADKHAALQHKEKQVVEKLAYAERQVQELEQKRSADVHQSDERKRQIHELMENLSKMTTVTADQSKQLQELELGRREELDRMKDAMHALDAEKLQLVRAKDEVQQQLDQQLDAFQQLQTDKAKQWNEIMTTQLSANLLIEEQAHTIDTLLKKSSRFVSPSKSESVAVESSPGASPQLRSQREVSSVSGVSEPSVSPVSGVGEGENGSVSATVALLRHECELLRDELTQRTAAFAREQESLQCEYEQKVVELMNELTALQRVRAKLKRRLDEQAVTIHELTLQEDDDNEEDEEAAEEVEEDEEEDIDDRPAHQSRRVSHGAHRNQRRYEQPHPQRHSEKTPLRRPSRAQPSAPATRIRKPRAASGQYHPKALSRMHLESDDDPTVGMSFLSATVS